MQRLAGRLAALAGAAARPAAARGAPGAAAQQQWPLPPLPRLAAAHAGQAGCGGGGGAEAAGQTRQACAAAAAALRLLPPPPRPWQWQAPPPEASPHHRGQQPPRARRLLPPGGQASGFSSSAADEAARRRLLAAQQRRQRQQELDAAHGRPAPAAGAPPPPPPPAEAAGVAPAGAAPPDAVALAPQDGPPTEVQVRDVVGHEALVVTRAIEWGTLILGFEQATKYTVYDQEGTAVALIAEEVTGLANELQRQLLRTRRSFVSTVLSADGSQVVFRVRRPAYLVSSVMYIEDPQGEVVGEVRQRWHLWRRNYDLFIGKRQFAAIRGGFLAWEFELQDAQGATLALIDRNFLGFARELFTDAGKYVIHFGYSPPEAAELARRTIAARSGRDDVAVTPVARARTGVAVIPTTAGNQLVVARPLPLPERLVALAAAISVDYGYFSPHSHGSGVFAPPLFMPTPVPGGVMGGGGAAAEGAAGGAAAAGAAEAAGGGAAAAAEASAEARAAEGFAGLGGRLQDDAESFRWDVGEGGGGGGGGTAEEEAAGGAVGRAGRLWAMIFGD